MVSLFEHVFILGVCWPDLVVSSAGNIGRFKRSCHRVNGASSVPDWTENLPLSGPYYGGF